jgi:hypothetical protein
VHVNYTSSVTRSQVSAATGINRINRDRAAVLTPTILQIVATAPDSAHALENYLRDEITDIQRQAIADGEPPDA